MSFPKYPRYKDSGVEWLGEVPEHWNIVQMKRVATIRYGIGEPPRYYGEGTPLIRATNVHAGRLFSEGMAFVDPSEIPEQRIVWLATGDIIVVRSGAYTGDSAIIPDGFGPCIAGFDMVLRCHSARPRFLQFAMLSRYLKNEQIDLEKMRAAQPHLNAEELGSCVLILPADPEQTLIAAFLDRETAKIDGLVAEQQGLIELLKEKRQAVISHAVTKGLNRHAPMKPSGIEWLGDVPKAWTVTKLGRAAFMQEGPGLRNWQFTDDGTRVICVTNITENGIDFSRLEKFISTDEYSSSYVHFTVQTGDVLLSSSGNSWGKVAIYDGDEKVILNTSTIRLNELEGSPLIRDFLAILLRSGTVREQLWLAMTGSCQPNFGPTHLNSVMVTVPSRQEQSDIVAFVAHETAKLDELAAEAVRGIELLQERRTALISAAVTGKIDVREIDVSDATTIQSMRE